MGAHKKCEGVEVLDIREAIRTDWEVEVYEVECVGYKCPSCGSVYPTAFYKPELIGKRTKLRIEVLP